MFLNQDIIYEVSNHIPKGSWKNFIFTCKAFYLTNSSAKINKHCNTLLTLIKKYPNPKQNFPNSDSSWNWHEISCNPNITWEFIEENPDKEWNWNVISRNIFLKK